MNLKVKNALISVSNKEKLVSLLKILKKYNINIQIEDEIKYGLFPKPHFFTSNSSILLNNKNIAEINSLKIYITSSNFFKFNQVDVKDLYFKKTNFRINKNDLKFFVNLLKTEPNENEIIIKNSKIFFKGFDDELLFIKKIKKYKFYYDSKNLFNALASNNEIFNTPFKLIVKNDKFNQKLYSLFKSKKIRLTIDNEINYDNEIKNGIFDILFINKRTSIDYKIEKNSYNFSSSNSNNDFKGKMDFKPFYLHIDFNYNGLSTRKALDLDSIIFDLIKSEIFNNSNLNINLNLNVKDIVNIDELNDLKLKVFVEEGNINVSESSIYWKDDLKIVLRESLINNNNDSINLIGKVYIKIEDLDNFYKSFQIKKNFRKDINEIQFDIDYNFTNNDVSFDNVRINNNLNRDLENFINKFNSKTKREFNKITFKNFINKFFEAYSG